MNIVLGTRFFESDPQKAGQSLEKLLAMIQNAQAAGIAKIYVAVNEAVDKSGILQTPLPEGVVAFGVKPWGRFVLPLSAILSQARADLPTHNILFASVETTITSKILSAMESQLTNDTFVVGAALEGHAFQPGIHENANGSEVPWNTMALYHSLKLWVTGIPMIGDGIPEDPATGGVEELMTIAVAQALYPQSNKMKAKLLAIPGNTTWDTSHFTGDRLAAHNKKMASKQSRPAKQLAFSGLKGPTVEHIDLS